MYRGSNDQPAVAINEPVTLRPGENVVRLISLLCATGSKFVSALPVRLRNGMDERKTSFHNFLRRLMFRISKRLEKGKTEMHSRVDCQKII